MVSSITNKYAIKSGSTNTDAWVAGYNPQVVLISWQGYDDNKKIENNVVSNNKDSWISSMEYYFKYNDATWYETPKNVSGILVNPITGENPKNSDKKRILYFINGTYN